MTNHLTPSVSTARPSLRRLRGLALAAAAAVALTAGVAVAAPANAATGSGSVKVCFVNTNGTPWTGNTYSQYWSNGAWVNGTSVGGTSNGCRVWSAAAGNYLRFYGNQVFRYGLHGQSFSSSYTSWVHITSGSYAELPTYTVNQTLVW